jgi:hypothetical protein
MKMIRETVIRGVIVATSTSSQLISAVASPRSPHVRTQNVVCGCASTTRAARALGFGREEAVARVSLGGVYAYINP